MSTNTIRRRDLNRLLPEGAIITRTWLMNHDFGRHAIDNLIKSKMLTTVAPGVYTRQDAKPIWQGVVYFLQENLGLNLTVGGLSALDLMGLSHYLPFATQKKIHLYGTAHLPS
ncbi:MAG TPA: AbiEi antitoxin N-terminal domain-containing protein [Puia sp.]